jgi:phosphoglycerol transferase MdoB-like AlkP superfamily enzyme
MRSRLRLYLRFLLTILVMSMAARLAFLTLFRAEAVRFDAGSVLISVVAGLRFDFAAFAMVFTLPLVLFSLPGSGKPFKYLLWIIVLTLHFLWFTTTVGDMVFYSISHRRSAAEFFALFASAKDFWAFIKGSAIYVIVGLPLGITPFYFLYRKEVKREREPLPVLTSAGLIGVMVLLGIIAVRGGLQGRPLNVTHAFIVGDYFLGNVTLNPVFATVKLAYTGDALPVARALGDLPLGEVRKLVAAEGETFHDEEHIFYRTTHPRDKMLRKNVVVFIMESWSAADLGWFGNPHKATPHFDAIANHALNYKNAFAVGNRSITAIPTIASSIMSLFGKPYTTSSYANNKQRGMGSVFAEKGYATYFVTGYKAGAQGFSTYMRVAGFEKIVTRENLGLGPEKSDGVWGIYDHYTFEKLHQILSAETRPFIAVVPSLHPHHPYKLPDDYKDREYYKDITRAGHFNALRYSDFALGRFFELARRSAYFRDTVFVITADHTYTQNGVLAKYRIPLVFYAPGYLPREDREETASQLDILPTLIDMLNVDTAHSSMGKSVWSKRNGTAWAVIDLDGSMGYLAEPFAVLANREAAVAAYDMKGDPNFSSDLLGEKKPAVQERVRTWFSYMNAISDSIAKNRIAP